jgi:hypothetical protein
LKIAVACLVRNEIDIIGTFLQHLDALFDYVVLLNHHSLDGTERVMEQACAERPGWTLWQVDPIGYHQTIFSVFALNHLMVNTDADIVLFLDADEFIDVPNRATLEAAFATLTDPDRVGNLRWRNAVPARLNERFIVPGEPFWRAPEPSHLGKAVIPRLYYNQHLHHARLIIGNHGLNYGDTDPVPSDDIGEILHMPIRSQSQLKNKVLAGVFALMSNGRRQPIEGWHWFNLLWRIGDGTLGDEDILGILARYGEPDSQNPQPITWVGLEAVGFTPATLNVAFGRPLPPITYPLTVDPVRLAATVLRRFQVENVEDSKLVLEDDHLRFVPKDSNP